MGDLANAHFQNLGVELSIVSLCFLRLVGPQLHGRSTMKLEKQESLFIHNNISMSESFGAKPFLGANPNGMGSSFNEQYVV